jgi:large subunit ribosomal protein L28
MLGGNSTNGASSFKCVVVFIFRKVIIAYRRRLHIPKPKTICYNDLSISDSGAKFMSSKRKITNVTPQFGQSRSKAFNTVKRKFKPNIQTKRIYVPELDQFVKVRVTAKEIKTIDKIGLATFLKRQGKSLKSLL